MISVMYFGDYVCGHPGMVHGGLIATVFDEGLARTCFDALPSKTGVTANLSVNYRKPVFASQFVVLEGSTVKVEGRKAWVKGELYALGEDGMKGQLLADATALYVEPKGYASQLMKLVTR